ncbi:MAG: hypothetical protein AAF958_15435 [Planctomycetota bacterium]
MNATKFSRCAHHGLTLIELIIVLIILVGLGGLMIPLFAEVSEDSARSTTSANLVAVRNAVVRQWNDTKLVPLPGPLATPATIRTEASEATRFHLHWLFENPANDPADAGDDFTPTYDSTSSIGWNGPYLLSHSGRYTIDTINEFTSDYGAADDKAIFDSYTGSPIVMQVVGLAAPYDVRIVSAGRNGKIDIDRSWSTDSLVPEGGINDVVDDEYVSFILR